MGSVREGGAIHTEGEWFAGGGSWVAAANPINGDISGSDDVDYYGGHLIGESISSCNIPIISAAPDMFKALLAVKQKLHFLGMPGEKVCKVTGKSDWSDEIKLIEAALTKAVTRVPVPEKVAPVAPSIDVGEGWRVIGDEETLIEGDEYTYSIPPRVDDWHSVSVNIGKVKNVSSVVRSVCRRKVDPVSYPGADPCAVGAGYRLIGDDEVFIAGDEFDNNHRLAIPMWLDVEVCLGQRKGDSTLAKLRCRRKVGSVTPCFEVMNQQKPPLGLMPRQIWLENRRDDIYDAIARYRDAGKDVRRDWLNELLDLDNEMRPF